MRRKRKLRDDERQMQLYLKDNPQWMMLLKHFSKGKSITQLEAIGVYRIFNLKGRINDLRNMGYEIDTVMVTDRTGKRYARYSFSVAQGLPVRDPQT